MKLYRHWVAETREIAGTTFHLRDGSNVSPEDVDAVRRPGAGAGFGLRIAARQLPFLACLAVTIVLMRLSKGGLLDAGTGAVLMPRGLGGRGGAAARKGPSRPSIPPCVIFDGFSAPRVNECTSFTHGSIAFAASSRGGVWTPPRRARPPDPVANRLNHARESAHFGLATSRFPCNNRRR